ENAGPSDAVNVTVTDALDDCLLDATYSVNGADRGAWTGSHDVGTLAAGGTVLLEITATVDPSCTEPIANTALATSDTLDPDEDAATDTTTTDVDASANLVLTKTGPEEVTAGKALTYTITVENTGPSDALDVEVTDTLDACLLDPTYTVDGQDEGSWDGAHTLGTLAAGATVTVEITATVDPSCTEPITNTAEVSSTTEDPDPGSATDSTTTAIDTSADLSLTKTASPDPVIAGEELTYTITVENEGPSVALDVEVADTVPSELLNVEYSTDGGASWSAWSSPYNHGTMAVGDSFTFLIRGTVDSAVADGTTISNTATAESATPDPDIDSATTTETTTITTLADLEIEKSQVEPTTLPSISEVSPSEAVPGTKVYYFLTVTNLGPSYAANVVITDVLPPGITNAEYSLNFGNSWQPWPGTRELISFMFPGVNEILIRGDIDPDLTGTVENTATVTSDTDDPDPDNNSSTIVTTLTPQADLALTKVETESPVSIGGPIEYVITVTNQGPSTATDVTITDIIDPGIISDTEYSTDGGSTWSEPWTDSLDLGTLEDKASLELRIRGTVLDGAPDPIPNTASVASSVDDPDLGNNSQTINTPLEEEADLAVEKSAPDTVVAGEQILFTIEVVNNSATFDAHDVEILDSIDTSVIENPEYSTDGGTTWSQWTGSLNIGTLEATGTYSLQLRGTVLSNVIADIDNTAQVTSSTPDPIPENNQSSTATSVNRVADLEMVKVQINPEILPIDPAAVPDNPMDLSINPVAVTAGEPVYYLLVYTNDGPSDATNVLIEDTVPPEIINPEASRCQAAYLPWAGTYNAGTVVAGGRCLVVIRGVVRSDATGSITNTGTVGTLDDIDDPVPSNDTSTLVSTVNTSADLTLTKTASPGQPVAGEELTYTITVENTGPSDALDVEVTDTLDACLLDPTYTVDGQDEGSWEGAHTLGTLAAGATVTVEITATVDLSCTEPITNTASVSTETDDPDLDNNTDSTTTDVDTSADLAITKATSPDPAIAGEPLTYTITVENAGPSDARDVVVTEDWPDCFRFLGANPSPEPGTTDRWNIDQLAAGESLVITVEGAVESGCTEDLLNTAEVDALTQDPDLANNSVTLQNTVAQLEIDKTAEWVGQPELGLPIFYEVLVTNVGTTPLFDLEVIDNLVHLDFVGGDENADGVLDPGETWIYEGTYEVAADDLGRSIVNIATADAQTSAGDSVGPVMGTATVPWGEEAPQAQDAWLVTCAGEPLTLRLVATDRMINPLEPDLHPLSFSLLGAPSHGAVAGDLSAVEYEEPNTASVEVTYIPEQGFIGTDSFMFLVEDRFGDFSVAQVRIAVVDCEAGAAAVVGPPVLISEIAWGGTAADPDHQWIELANTTEREIDLAGWVLRWRLKDPPRPEDAYWKVVELEGTIAPRGYYLMERATGAPGPHRERAVSDIEAALVYDDTDLPYELDLSDRGEVLELVDNDGDVVDTANADPRREDGWAAGYNIDGAAPFATMERVDLVVGDVDENWSANAKIVVSGLDDNEQVLTGTARMRNEDEWLRNVEAQPAQAVRQGQEFEVTLPADEKATPVSLPWIALVRADEDQPKSEWERFDSAVSGRFYAGVSYICAVDTSELPAGMYQLWLNWSDARSFGFRIEVVED
ncbi:MAG: CARDB domain-containing protein, partial [Candidatus Bipolaricaulota bacterium]